MAYVTKAWKNREVQYPGRWILTDTSTGTQQRVIMTRDEGTITEIGDKLDANNMNDLEDRISDAFGTELTGTLAAGSTSITISDASILTTSTIDIYTDVYGINPIAVTVVTGSVTLMFEAQQAALGVKVVVK